MLQFAPMDRETCDLTFNIYSEFDRFLLQVGVWSNLCIGKKIIRQDIHVAMNIEVVVLLHRGNRLSLRFPGTVSRGMVLNNEAVSFARCPESLCLLWITSSNIDHGHWLALNLIFTTTWSCDNGAILFTVISRHASARSISASFSTQIEL